MIILFRTYGGLGNQIFQFYFLGCVLSKYGSGSVYHVHSTNYSRLAEFEFPTGLKLMDPGWGFLQVIRMRIPAILRRLGFRTFSYLKLGNLLIIDGYCQYDFDYFCFSKSDLVQSRIMIRECLGIELDKVKNKERLCHLRLGDFFKSDCEKRSYVISCLNSLEKHTHIVSNEDSLFIEDSEIRQIIENKQLLYFETGSYSSIQLFHFFCNYEVVVSSGSSLSFAAAIFVYSEIQPEANMTGLQKSFFERLSSLMRYLS